MGKVDIITKQYIEDNAIFADAFNFMLYEGQQVIQPEKLHILNTEKVEVPYGADGAKMPVQKVRDELKYLTSMSDDRRAYVILGIESQSNVHYAMPVKNMVYDALQYAGQVRKAAASHRKAKDSAGHLQNEYLSGFYKDDKLLPVVTLVMFFSAESWDGPMSLYDMLDETDEQVMAKIDNYRIHLIAPQRLSDHDLGKFKTNLREVLGFIKYSKDKEKLNMIVSNNKGYAEMDKKAAMVIETCTGTDLKIGEQGEVVNVCQAILDMKMEERTEGRREGRVLGICEGLIQARARDIITLMEYLHCTAEKAMDILKLSDDERQKCMERIAKIKEL